jgi:hypothetical protein
MWFGLQVVLEVLVTAARQGKRFRVLVVDSRPELEGRQMLRQLLQVWHGVGKDCLLTMSSSAVPAAPGQQSWQSLSRPGWQQWL